MHDCPPPEVGSTIRQGWEDWKTSLDETMKLSDEIAKPLLVWYREHKSPEDKKLVLDYLRWRQSLYQFAQEMYEQDVVAPTQELNDRIEAHRTTLRNWAQQLKDKSILVSPITVPEKKTEQPGSSSDFWKFIKYATYGTLAVAGIYGIAELASSLKTEQQRYVKEIGT